MGRDNRVLVAELDGKVVGIAGFHLFKSARQRHDSKSRIQGPGIGKKLLEKILDPADNWLMLVKVELDIDLPELRFGIIGNGDSLGVAH